MLKILKSFGSVKAYFAEMGLIAGFFAGIFMVLSFVLFFPFFLIEYLNDSSKRWFGGDSYS